MIERLRRLAEISPLPAWYLTGAVGLIWLAAAFGADSAAAFWHDNATTIIGAYLGALGLWLGSKKIPNRAAAKDPTTWQG